MLPPCLEFLLIHEALEWPLLSCLHYINKKNLYPISLFHIQPGCIRCSSTVNIIHSNALNHIIATLVFLFHIHGTSSFMELLPWSSACAATWHASQHSRLLEMLVSFLYIIQRNHGLYCDSDRRVTSHCLAYNYPCLQEPGVGRLHVLAPKERCKLSFHPSPALRIPVVVIDIANGHHVE